MGPLKSTPCARALTSRTGPHPPEPMASRPSSASPAHGGCFESASAALPLIQAFVRTAGLLACCAAFAVDAAPRSTAAKHAFQRSAPCPATGNARGACPGYVIDHVHPLCAGGADSPANMQWQSVADAKIKDREEAKECRVKTPTP